MKQRMTEERFNNIKTILDGLEKTNTGKHKRGVLEIYKILNIASSTASYINRSETYDDYVALIKEKCNKKNNIKQTTPFNPEPVKTDLEVIILILEDLNKKLDTLLYRTNKRRLF